MAHSLKTRYKGAIWYTTGITETKRGEVHALQVGRTKQPILDFLGFRK
jgi:hypothetical protein